ncbi:Protein bicaudal D [Fasciolopsis buskii]|uniref:Protein bicaudal D n=1 Tax=Fasciolopsis buskii TaxID=27845 RepID=A0A8E0S1X6_9TREM|nr:Protein bicaudal D [Fasciolopsis buski]
MAESKVHSLQEENRQLQNALREALQEKYEAAQYGLRLLEEKQQLQNQLEELEKRSEEVNRELKLSKQTSQVEFESPRHEFKRLREDNEIIDSQLKEITRLKRMTEKSLEEALESLQIERDQRHNLRKELDSRLTSESMYHFTSLRHDLKGSVNLNLTNRDGTPNSSQVFEKIDAALMEKLGPESKSVQEDARLSQSNSVVKGSNGESALSPADNLFAELRVTEMAKY